MKKYVLIVAILSFSLSFSQVGIKKSSLSTGGGAVSAGSLYMVYAIGEIGVQEATTGNLHLSEGFVGPDITALVGIKDYGQLDGISVFPNPVKDNVNIELPKSQNYEVHLYDLTGKQIFVRTIEDDDQANYNLSNLKPGMYLMSIVDRIHKKAKIIKIQKL